MNDLNLVASSIERSISKELLRVGILFRIFSRVKSQRSIDLKQKKKNYSKGNKMMQDLVGARITLYFADDIEIVTSIIKAKFNIIEIVKDQFSEEVFSPIRLNIVCKMNQDESEITGSVFNDSYNFIDDTFEIQLRSVLSEGWHEVEHDLRYKCKTDWDDSADLSRALNGILATLETSEWSMLSLFKEMSLRNYKNNRWSSLMRSKFRMRFIDNSLSKELIEIIEKSEGLGKKIFKFDRSLLLRTMNDERIDIPLTMDNVLFILNYIYLKDKFLMDKTPEILKLEFKSIDIVNLPAPSKKH